MIKLLIFSFLLRFGGLHGHEGHQHHDQPVVKSELFTPFNHFSWTKWQKEVGKLHFVFLHFPIALIFMTVIAEICLAFTKGVFYENAARFMLISAAVFSLPTLATGYIMSLTMPYTGSMALLLEWHMWLGIVTAALAITVATVREKRGNTAIYYTLLIALFLIMNVTAYLGGVMTFGV